MGDVTKCEEDTVFMAEALLKRNGRSSIKTANRKCAVLV